MAQKFIFVYGTLRKQTATAMSNLLNRHGNYVTDGYLQAKLYEVKDYPAAIDSDNPNDKVYGDVYELTNTIILLELDNYEECTYQFPEPHEYRRQKRRITLSDGRLISARVYIFNHPVSDLTPIMSGDYLHYCVQGNE